MSTPTPQDFDYMRKRAFIMRGALNELDALLAFNLTAEQIREEGRRIIADCEAKLASHRDASRPA